MYIPDITVSFNKSCVGTGAPGREEAICISTVGLFNVCVYVFLLWIFTSVYTYNICVYI
jgi:hypothetical protein